MRILFYNDYSNHLGGAETYLQAVVEALEARGFTTRTVAYDHTCMCALHTARYPARAFWRSQFRHVHITTAFRSAIADFRPDIIHINKNNLYTRSINDVLAEVRIPVVATVHDLYSLCANDNLKTRIKKTIFRQLLRAERYIIPGKTLFNCLKEKLSGKAVYLPHFIDCGQWPYQSPDPANKNRLLFVGRLEYAKGIFTLFEAARKVMAEDPTVTLTCIGSGKDEGRLRALIQRHRLQHNIYLTGYQGRESIVRAMHESTLLVCPSLKPELFGLVGIEAQACGLPVIASHAGGTVDWCIDGKTGLLAPPGAVDTLQAQIQRLRNDAGLRQQLSERAFQFVRNTFDKKQVLDRLAGLYHSLLM